MEDALLMLPHTLDCSTDTTGVGGPARLLHCGLAVLRESSLRGPGPARGPTGVISPTLPERPGAGSNGGIELGREGAPRTSRLGPAPLPRALRERPARFAWGVGTY